MKRFTEYLRDRHLVATSEETADDTFPWVSDVAVLLVPFSVGENLPIGNPPRNASPILNYSLGPELISIDTETIDVDFSDSDRQEATTAGLVLEIAIRVGCAPEDARSRAFNDPTARVA